MDDVAGVLFARPYRRGGLLALERDGGPRLALHLVPGLLQGFGATSQQGLTLIIFSRLTSA